MRKTVLVFAVFIAYGAGSPTVYGSVLIINLTKDKLTMAADSRGIPRNLKGDGPPNDAYCKLAAFRHQVVFASVGTVEYPSLIGDPVLGWNNIEEARVAVRSAIVRDDPEQYIEEIANHWGTAVVADFSSYYKWNSPAVRHLSAINNGALTSGFFAYAKNGKIYTRIVIVTLSPLSAFSLTPIIFLHGDFSNLTDCSDCWQGTGAKVCTGGANSVPMEFCLRSSPRAIQESQRWKKLQSTIKISRRSTRLAIRLVELTEKYDKGKTVGGPIDAIELLNTGSIRWAAHKCNCPENQD